MTDFLRPAIRVRWRSALVLGVAVVLGLLMFCWPLLVNTTPGAGHGVDAPFVFMATLPVLILIVLAELSSGGLDSKALALLGVLSAVDAALRPLGAGTGGIELVFFLLVLAGRVFGPGFGFVLGATSLFASALLTGGVGPWLPFQMLASSMVGMGAGLLPSRVKGRWEIAMLAGYGVLAAYFYGLAMSMFTWPFLAGSSALDFVPGAPLADNLHRFLVFTVLTSTIGWDTGRALTNLAAILLLGPAILLVLRRAARRAAFGPAS
ncbi:ECF transporter S component [Amycolatopsis saalfeldensis]|uniref:Energy-coupling factor transport system substrate-specific component n=1 Tax=Amycolatopsis saalfeldensis TaxID=394193 RepID=A0A1H8YJG7_9PSEU|nr:ECF transporter S component [Amycolatopsis saalfeldensis]SEP52296.1 energy-coupling factor transport system substrate-specific component [Amycolatopsis saalfeldensis]